MYKSSLVALLATVTLMTGCATKQPQFTKDDCASLDWYKVGVQDGTYGHNAQRILSHQKTCPTASDLPNRALWEEGRQLGLKSYCTKENAYEMGRRGYELTGVCDQNLEELHRANIMGLEQYGLSQRIHRPYFYDYYNPFFAPWYFY